MSDVFASRKVLFVVPPAFGDEDWVLDCTWLGPYMETPRLFTFISGLERPVLSSIDTAHFAP